MTTPSFDYTQKDYNTIKDSMQRYLQARFPTTWKNIYESDIGVMWVEIVAYAFDQITYFVNKQANETYLATAMDRESITNIVKLVGYQPRNPTAASVNCKFTLPAVDTYNVVIPSGTILNSSSGVVFQALFDIVVPAGVAFGYGVLTAGQTSYMDFTSDGSKFQRFLVTNSSWVNASITVEVNGVSWVNVESLLEGDSSSKIFSVDVAPNQNFYACFGDGISGAIPPNGSSVRVYYRIGGGVSGNISIGDINQTVLGYREGTSPVENINVSAYNDDTGSGGEDAEDTDSIKLWAPKWARANKRAVSAEDFDVLASKFNDPTYGSPARAKAMLKQESPESNTVIIYLWSRDYQNKFVKPSSALKSAVQNYFDNNGSGSVRLMCVDTEVEDGEIVYINFGLTVTIESTAKSDVVTTNINTALSDLFDSVFNQPGVSVRISKIYETVMAVSGVKYCLINTASGMLKGEEVLAIAGSTQQTWSGTLGGVPLWGLTPGEVEFTDGTQIVSDDGEGNLVGNVDTTYSNVITYEDQEFTGIYMGVSGSKQYSYSISDLPVVPGSVKIQSDNQIIFDNGGKLIGDVDPLGVNTIDYDTGAIDVTFLNTTTSVVRLNYYKKSKGVYSFKFASAPSGSSDITSNYKYYSSYYKDEKIGEGDGVRKSFNFVLSNPPSFRKSIVVVDSGLVTQNEIKNGDGGASYSFVLNSFPIPGTMRIITGSYLVQDTGYGVLTGDINISSVNCIDYSTGAVTVTFSGNIPVGVGNILIEYSIPTSNVVYDDGYRNLLGAVDYTKSSTIDYTRGSLNLNLQSSPVNGNDVKVHYLSLLNSPSEDMRIGNNQLASLNEVNVTIERD